MTPSDLVVGADLPVLKIEPISRRSLALFACGSGDHQPIHIDIEAAQDRGRDDVIAHGMLSMAYMSRLLTDWIPQEKIRAFKTRFTAVTPVLATPTCTGNILSIEGNLARIEITVTLADGTVTAKGEALIQID